MLLKWAPLPKVFSHFADYPTSPIYRSMARTELLLSQVRFPRERQRLETLNRGTMSVLNVSQRQKDKRFEFATVACRDSIIQSSSVWNDLTEYHRQRRHNLKKSHFSIVFVSFLPDDDDKCVSQWPYSESSMALNLPSGSDET